MAKAVHLGGIAVLFGSIALLDLRLLGFRPQLSARRLAGRVLPWTAAGFALIVPSGLVMFTAYAADFIANPLFALKMSLILGAGVNAAVFHAGVFRRWQSWDVDGPPPAAARAAGALSLALWISVIACGWRLAEF